MKRINIVTLLIVGLALRFASSALAQQDEVNGNTDNNVAQPTSESRLEQLEQKQRILERKLELAEEKAAEDRKKTPLVSAAPGKGFNITLPDDKFSMSIRARAQIRETIAAQSGTATTNELNVKTLRLWTQGFVLSKYLGYGIQLAFGGNDFEAGSSSPIFDAYVEYTKLRDLNIRVGQYFVPFDRARTIREFALQLVDRQLAVTELNLDRDVGITLSSNDLFGSHNIVGYQLSLFGGEGRNRFGGSAPGFLYVLRVTVRPWGLFDDDQEGDLQRLYRPRLAIAVAGAFNQNTNRQRSTTGNTFTLGTFSYVHAAADLVFKYGGFSFLAEFLYRQALDLKLVGMAPNGTPLTEYSRSGLGYLLQAGYMLTRHVEIAARWDQQHALYATDPAYYAQLVTAGKEFGTGVNVYLNGHAFKLQADYAASYGDDIAKARHQVRLQLDATF